MDCGFMFGCWRTHISVSQRRNGITLYYREALLTRGIIGRAFVMSQVQGAITSSRKKNPSAFFYFYLSALVLIFFPPSLLFLLLPFSLLFLTSCKVLNKKDLENCAISLSIFQKCFIVENFKHKQKHDSIMNSVCLTQLQQSSTHAQFHFVHTLLFPFDYETDHRH